ncbi:MAG TPA: glycosyltransferase family 4 protein [Solirubrobacteraceae bacterium]|nr:glycosyltransferase family 4 protein [Solirubrobacteraceae bacterium]
MRILLIHNRYRWLGGEERAVEDIADLLTRRGHTVERLARSRREVGRTRAARSLLGGGLDPGEVAAAVRRLRADVVHAHNVHPLFGWRALAAARAAGARTVLHVHNFRLFCAIAVAYRDGAPCYRCRGRDTAPGLRLRCRGSVAEAAVYAAALHLQQPHLFKDTDRFIVVSAAHGARLRELGLPAEKTSSLPNFIPTRQFAPASRAGEGKFALVAGRLVEEKGYDTAIRAARAAGVPLLVAGEGPDEPRLRGLAAGGEIRFAGLLAPAALAAARQQAAVVLVPSRCEEACPYAVLDALAAGIPVLGSSRGGVPELIGAESALDPEDPDAWAEALAGLWADPARREASGNAALNRGRERLGEERYYEGLMAIYAGA